MSATAMALLSTPAFKAIHQLFKPVQPTVSGEAGVVRYVERPPTPTLAPLIHCYWQLATQQPLSQPFVYRVVADGCIDLFFDLLAPDDLFVMGLSTTYTEFPLTGVFNYAGVRFLPTALPLLYRVDASELTNRIEAFRDVVPTAAGALTELIAGHTTLETLKPLLDGYFTRQFTTTNVTPDHRLIQAIAAILTSGGTLNVLSELDAAISHRQLSRLFQRYVGDTPKVFSRIVRFQQLLNARPSIQTLQEDKVFYDLGYYDQAHFIKEFKTLYGQTPRNAAKDVSGPL
ncbi:helix-turn-helix domain-containing protein [Fibrisoma limi]|uniref:helix-turn-helix domain-containing protein n=1 Tax=Fibrisoma limi TaxID=663275 RepID=UPI001E5AC52F|nr:helix-turn-helix domain-containing protein [Fibrisoma limi]